MERQQDASEAEFEEAVLAARIGYVTAMSNDAARRWDGGRASRKSSRHRGAELAGEGLERALRFMAWQHGDLVTSVSSPEGFEDLRSRERGILREMRLARARTRGARDPQARSTARLARRATRKRP